MTPPCAPHVRHTYRGNISRTYLFIAVTNFILWQPVWIIFFQRGGLSLGQIGLLEILTTTLLAAAEVPTGAVADTWGRKWSMALGAALHGVAVLGVLTAVLSPAFLISYAIWGVSFSFITGAGDAFAYDSLRSDGRASHFGHVASRLAMTKRAARGLSGLAGGGVAAYDLRLCFVLTAVCCFIGSFIILTGHEPPAEPATEHHGARYWTTLRAGVGGAVRNARVRYLLLIGALVDGMAMLLVFTAFQPYATEAGLPVWSFGVALIGMQACGVAGSYLAGRVNRSRERVLSCALFGIVGSLLALWLGASPATVGFFGVGVGLAALAQPILSTLLNERIPDQQRATILSLQSLVSMLGFGIAQLALLAVAQRTSMGSALGLAGALAAGIALTLLALLPREPALELPAPAPSATNA